MNCFTNPLELGTRVSLSHRQPNWKMNCKYSDGQKTRDYKYVFRFII